MIADTGREPVIILIGYAVLNEESFPEFPVELNRADLKEVIVIQLSIPRFQKLKFKTLDPRNSCMTTSTNIVWQATSHYQNYTKKMFDAVT